jgi:hypothetical protein
MHTRIGRMLLGAGIAVVMSGCVVYTKATPEEMRETVIQAGVIGNDPAEVERRLQGIVLSDGRRLEVGSFDPRRGVVPAVLPDARRRVYQTWNLYTYVRFDSTRKATSVESHYSAENPM